MRQSRGVWVIKAQSDYWYYSVNTKYNIIKSIEESEYKNLGKEYLYKKDEVLSRAQSILSNIGINIPISDIVVLNNKIYFFRQLEDETILYSKYDINEEKLYEKITVPEAYQFQENTYMLHIAYDYLVETAAYDMYPVLREKIEKLNSTTLKYQKMIISDNRIIICYLSNSTNQVKLYQYSIETNHLSYLTSLNDYPLELIIIDDN